MIFFLSLERCKTNYSSNHVKYKPTNLFNYSQITGGSTATPSKAKRGPTLGIVHTIRDETGYPIASWGADKNRNVAHQSATEYKSVNYNKYNHSSDNNREEIN